MERYKNSWMMVVEDFGAVALKDSLTLKTVSSQAFLDRLFGCHVSESFD